jgi:MFS family permease
MSGTHFVQHCLNRMLPPLIPLLAVSLGYPLWKLGVLVTLSSLGSGFGQAPSGVLSDRYDRRFILPTGLFVAAGAYTVFGLSPSLGSLLRPVVLAGQTFEGPFLVMSIAVLVAGVGRSVVHPTGYPLISANVSEADKGKVLGMWGSSAKLGDAASPAIIGVLLLALVWNHIVVILGVAGLLFSTLLFVALGADRFETRPPETVEAAEGDAASADPPADADGDTNPRDVDRRVFVYPMLAVLGFFVARKLASKGVSTFVPAFITGVYGYSITIFGVPFAPESFANFYFSALLVMAAVVQLGTGTLADRFDHRSLIVGFMLAASVALYVLANATLRPLGLLVVLLIVGAGIWGINPARDALVSDISPAAREGRTFGYLWTAGQMIGAVMPVVLGYIADVSGIKESFRFLALGTVLAALTILVLYSDRVYLDD